MVDTDIDPVGITERTKIVVLRGTIGWGYQVWAGKGQMGRMVATITQPLIIPAPPQINQSTIEKSKK